MMDTSIPVRAGAALNVARQLKGKPDEHPLAGRASYAQHRGDNPTVRVFRNQPYRLELQIRTGLHYGHCSLAADDAKAVIAALTEGLTEITTPQNK